MRRRRKRQKPIKQCLKEWRRLTAPQLALLHHRSARVNPYTLNHRPEFAV
jgi:hypothetical protein